MIIDCVSDLHGYYPKLKGGDLLIVAGDLANGNTKDEFKDFSHWLDCQNYRKKIFIAGNHDNFVQEAMEGMVGTSGMFQTDKEKVFLCDSGAEFGGLKIWGSPWTTAFIGMNPTCKAFTLDTEKELAEKWALIPEGIDILITHSPPLGVMDQVKQNTKWGTRRMHVGSAGLAARVSLMQNLPKLWVWGHVHEGYGTANSFKGRPCKMVNASHVNERYEPVNEPVRIEL